MSDEATPGLQARASAERRMSWKPTGTAFDTPRVPRKSRSPSARSVAPRSSMACAVATALSVTPAHPTSAWSSTSPEQALRPLPAVAGCSPATTSTLPVSIEQLMPSPSFPPAFNVTSAVAGVSRLVSFMLKDPRRLGRRTSCTGNDVGLCCRTRCCALRIAMFCNGRALPEDTRVARFARKHAPRRR